MTPLAALILHGVPSIQVGGLTLAERAILVAARVGLPTITWGPHELDPASMRRLAARGVAPAAADADRPPLAGLDPETALVVVTPEVLFSPGLLAAFAAGSAAAQRPSVVAVDGVPVMLYVPGRDVAAVAGCRTIGSMAETLGAVDGGLLEVPAGVEFARVIHHPSEAATAERAYIRHLNGKESYFTKKIRRFSVPLTSRLVRAGASPTVVTLSGFVLAAASAWCLASGHYLLGVAGGVLYYASMVFDCSDGEVARLTLRDSRFGAWLETIVDYSTYLMLWVALLVAGRQRPDAGALEWAAALSLAGSLVVIATASFLRFRVARADPGQFDEASSKAMASSTPLNRFARWGRQWIKRSTIAHLVVAFALVNQAPALLYLWAFGATVAALVILAVQSFVVQRVLVKPTRVTSST